MTSELHVTHVKTALRVLRLVKLGHKVNISFGHVSRRSFDPIVRLLPLAPVRCADLGLSKLLIRALH